MDPVAAAEFLRIWGYPAFLILLLATAAGSPIPEDLLLLLGGYLIAVDIFSWPVAMPLAFVGVTGSDTLLYYGGRQLRFHAGRWPLLARVVRPGRLRLSATWFGRLGDGVIFLARLVPGTRVVVFVTAGFRGVPPARFAILDALGALVWIPLLFVLGGELGDRVGGLGRAFGDVARLVTWLLVGLAILLVLRWLWGREESKL